MDLIEKAKTILEEVRGKKQSADNRLRLSIELAALITEASRQKETGKERKEQDQLAKMIEDPNGKLFLTAITDQAFRSKSYVRSADQLIYLLNKFGIPKFLPTFRRWQFSFFKKFGKWFPWILVPLAKMMIRKETSKVIIPEEKRALLRHLKKRKNEGVKVNLNHLGEAILGEEESDRRVMTYIKDLSLPQIDYISIKISTIYSQINLIGWENTLENLSDKLRILFRAAGKKFVNLDMEEYRDLNLTVALFKKVLDEPEFFHYSAGIVLQSYIPESFLVQQELTLWAVQRVAHGGAPIKIRIVKGANLAMEKLEASMRKWPQAPYLTKKEVDANFKRMVLYGSEQENAQAVRLGIASHNIFDISYALLLRSENKIESRINFEMLEGMADPMRRTVQELSQDMLLYCPVASQSEFQNAVAYLVRRLDENTAPENFLRNMFSLKPNTPSWKNEVNKFIEGYQLMNQASFYPRRTQNRLLEVTKPKTEDPFDNEADTDWTQSPNRKWASTIIEEHRDLYSQNIPKVNSQQIDQMIVKAKKAEEIWGSKSIKERSELLAKVANRFRKQRAVLIGAMIGNTSKTISEADPEVSEAIDFLEYYRKNINDFLKMPDIDWKPKGTVLVTPPWNFPCSIPTGCIAAALITGNCVIFKPAPEATWVGLKIAEAFWEGGISRDVLQFVVCNDEPEGSHLIKDPRINAILLTGGTSTALSFLKMRPHLDLIAETGGKNSIIVTSMADRDLAIKDIIQSAFSHAGQKCSACSLAILESEIYEDSHFLNQLRDAAASLKVGSPWNLSTRVNPLIRPAHDNLLRAMTKLERGEQWLLKPKQNPYNSNLWSPGIKLGVKPGSFMHQTELFGPVLSVMKADNLDHAVKLANETPYGLTAGLQSLDEREHKFWLDQIQAGNCYINREITGAIVQRQPFGGCKASSFGRGSKAGGPNYLSQLMTPKQISYPQQQELYEVYESLGKKIQGENKTLWKSSIGSYAYFWNHYFSKDHDPSQVRGEDNILRYVPQKKMMLRIQKNDEAIDVLRVITAAQICGTKLELSVDPEFETCFLGDLPLIIESNETFIQRIATEKFMRIRFISTPSVDLEKKLREQGYTIIAGPVLANGRLELLNYLREVSISIAYHRYGNLGERE